MALAYGKQEKKPGFQKAEEAEDGLVSMELDDEDKMDAAFPIAGKEVQPDFPWGLRINLTENELPKLGLDHKDASVGDYVEFRARACVTSVSEHKNDGGACCRVELQIEAMKILGEEE